MVVLRRSAWVIAAALLALVLFAYHQDHQGGGAASASKVAWGSDLPGALSRAASEKKLVMVDFYTDWCKWCQELDRTTYADGQVQQALARVVAVKLDAEKDGRQAAEQYGVDGFPTVIFLDARGREVGRIPGYLGPRPFLQELEDILHRA